MITKKATKKFLALILAMGLMTGIAGCGSKENGTTTESKNAQSIENAGVTEKDDVDGELILDHEEELLYAQKFTMTRYKGGYTMFTIPDTAEGVQYLIVPENKSVPSDLPENTIVLQQPINNFCFSSSGMVSLVDAINGLDNIATVSTNVDNWYIDNVIEKMNAGEIVYSGKYSEPDYELQMSEGVQVDIDTTMLLSHPEVMEKYDELGIIYVIESSSRESHPLGRVEWVKLLGAMMGLDQEAEEFFNAQVEKFEEVSALEKLDVTAVSFTAGDDNLNVHFNDSFYGATTIFAGCNYILMRGADDADNATSYEKYGFEDFYALTKDVDYMFCLSYSKFDTLEEMIAYNPLLADCKAVKDGNVYIFKSSFVQSSASVVDAITEIRSVLEDPSIEETSTLKKLK